MPQNSPSQNFPPPNSARPNSASPASSFATALSLAAALCGSAGLAQAQVRGTGDYLTRMDTDGNGKVSLREYQDWLSYAFDNMDRNRDGLLATEEQPGGRGKPITRDAHRARLAETFKRQDRNRDGALDAKELAAPPQRK